MLPPMGDGQSIDDTDTGDMDFPTIRPEKYYTRETLLEIRSSPLVSQMPLYIQEAIAARRNFCRTSDLSVVADGSGTGVTSSVAAPSAFAAKRVQTKTTLTRGGAKSDADLSTTAATEKPTTTAAAAPAGPQRRIISSTAISSKFAFIIYGRDLSNSFSNSICWTPASRTKQF